MHDYLVESGITVNEINGLEDHVHLLLRLKADVNLATLIGNLKGKTSYSLNKERIHGVPFRWARGYFIRSVAPSEVDVVRLYIRNQKFRREKKFQEWMNRHFGPPAKAGVTR
jgi:REP element-mobilizing transposase RayT